MFRTSLQTITWGDPQHDRFDHIFALARSSGFQGVEIGFRRLSQLGIAEVERLLDRHGIVINASHIGGNLADLGQAENERSGIEAVLDYLTALRIPFLLYSGLNEPQDDALLAAIRQLNGLAERCADNGVTLLFHNHDWEFHDDSRIWRRLREHGGPSLGFAPDLGWAAKAGEDLTAILDDLGDAVNVLHFKDFASAQAGQNTCHLGQGIIDFSPAWRWLETRGGHDIWLTAEQDNADDADEACRVNAAYLAGRVATLGAS